MINVKEHLEAIFIEPWRIMVGRTDVKPKSILWWSTLFFFVIPEGVTAVFVIWWFVDKMTGTP